MVDAPIGRSPRQPTRMAVTRGGRPARTAYTVVRRYRQPLEATLVEATLETGRTHQVRVHLAAIGHPVLGDDRYWGTRPRPPRARDMLGPGRLFLHACRLSLDHPDGGARRQLGISVATRSGRRPRGTAALIAGFSSGGLVGRLDLGQVGQVLQGPGLGLTGPTDADAQTGGGGLEGGGAAPVETEADTDHVAFEFVEAIDGPAHTLEDEPALDVGFELVVVRRHQVAQG